MNTTFFLALCLATWRVSSCLAYERGPYELFERLRHKAGVKYDAHSEPVATTELAKGLTCLWCNSVWVGFCFAFISNLFGTVQWPMLLILPLSLSAGAVLIQAVLERIEGDHGYDS